MGRNCRRPVVSRANSQTLSHLSVHIAGDSGYRNVLCLSDTAFATSELYRFYRRWYLAGYANIPSEIEEASKLEGATNWQRFRHIEVPLLAGSFTINIMLSTIGTLKTFELPFIMTRGGPDGATRTLSLHIIDSLFGKYKFGFASALSIIMLILVVLIAFIQNRYLRSREEIT